MVSSALTDMGGAFETYAPGDLPVTERTCSQLIFLPLLTEPVVGAASGILDAIRKVSSHSAVINETMGKEVSTERC